ncbi:VOC family protein [bacterium]|nr:VOC family protein [bacterium]
MQPNIYLFFAGDCLEAMSHYAKVLGGEIGSVFRNADAARPEDRMPGGDDMVMNMDVRFSGMTIFGSDNTSDMYQTPQGFRIQLNLDSSDDFDRMFDALSPGAREMAMPPGETFWAERFTMFTDRFGTPWMLNFDGSKMQG